MRRRPLATFLGLVALSACRDGTAPDPGVNVAISVARFTGPTVSETVDGPLINCDFELRASATGRGSATWLDATFRIYLLADLTTPVDSSVVGAGEIRQSWGADEIAAEETVESLWSVASPIPLAAELEFRYQPSVGRNAKSTKVRISCGPTIAPNSAPPTVTALSIAAPSGEVDAGAPLQVSYAADGAAGLWRTDVRVSGPCEARSTVAERLETRVERTVHVPLPPECRLGVPIALSLVVLDAVGRFAERGLSTQVVLADKTPPTIGPLFFIRTLTVAKPTFSGAFFAGDTIQFIYNAHDNYRLASLVWEVLPFGKRDSVFVSSRLASPLVLVPLDPTWSGPMQLRLYARDSVGHTSAVHTTHPDSAYVAPTVERPARTATVAGETRDFAIDSRRGLLYLAQGNDRRLAVVSLATMQLTETVPLPAVATTLDLTAGGDSLLLILAGRPELGVVDLRQSPLALSMLPIPGLDASVGEAPASVRVGSNGRAYVTLHRFPGTARTMLEVDLATSATRRLTPPATGGNPGVGFLERSHDRSVLVWTATDPWCFNRYDVRADAFSTCVPVNPGTWRPSVDGSGGRIAVSLDVFDASLRVIPKVGPPLVVAPAMPNSALSGDGESLFVIVWPHVVRVRASDGRVLDRAPNPNRPSLIRVSADGRVVVTVESEGGTTPGTTKVGVMEVR